MKYYSNILLFAGITFLFFIQCEKPGSPDFSLSRTIEFPLLQERTVSFLGSSDALIDTTTDSFTGLFTLDEDYFVTLSRDVEFNFDNLDHAVPDIIFEPEQFDAKIGPIRIKEFSSETPVAEVTFEELTGISSDSFQPGDLIPAGSTPVPVNISLETDYFVSARIIEGGISLELTNTLGVDISVLTLVLNSGETETGSVQFQNLNHGTSQNQTLQLPADVILEQLNASLTVSWGSQELQDTPDNFTVNQLIGDQLTASEIVAVIDQQEFTYRNQIGIAVDEFNYTSPEHYVEVKSGSLNVSEIENNLDLDLELFQLSFPGIRTYPFTPSDTLVVRLENDHQLSGKTLITDVPPIDLGGLRIYGNNNQVEYHLFVRTEDTRSESAAIPRTVNANDGLKTAMGIISFQMAEAFGIVSPRSFFLNKRDPAGTPGTIDLQNRNEARVIELEGLQDFSGKVTGIEFTDASITVKYKTNIGIPYTMIGAFAGYTENGEVIYLSGLQGTQAYVEDAGKATGLLAGGVQLGQSKLVRIPVDPLQTGQNTGSFTFNRKNSNVTEFLNKVPSEIHFIGKADVNRDQLEGRVQNPVEFSPVMIVDIPLSLKSLDEANYKDTFEQNLSELPDQEGDNQIEEGILYIVYHNRLPVGATLQFNFLDYNQNIITTLPAIGDKPIELSPSETDQSGFSTGQGFIDQTAISLSREQLLSLHRTEFIQYTLGLDSFGDDEVRLRATDTISFSVSSKFILNSTIN
jgi:hypothetical protein